MYICHQAGVTKQARLRGTSAALRNKESYMVAGTQDDGSYKGDVLGCLQVQQKNVVVLVNMLC